ncbi:MAG: AlkA N-terminal domain-containing protein [Acidimicrobiales bacterium]
MQGVSAVITTGIYCRRGCGAQPRPENVRRFPVAAAAEAAGYRACHRCRPYRLPPVVGSPPSELVGRAIPLVLDGALDHGTESTLAGRLGVSPRHLRRLFVTHLGATPDGLARSARAHFARSLLDDTDLTITEVAFAAGFGSLRQFNRACQQVFRASPRDLRARRRKSDRLVADGGLPLRLAFHGPLDWTACLAYLARVAIPGVEHVSGDVYRRTVELDGAPGVIELFPGTDDHLVLQAHLPRWRELLHIVNRARRIPNLDADLDEPVRRLDRDPVIGPLVRARPGVRVPGTWDAFETGVRAIVGQHVTRAAANAVIGRLVRRHGAWVGGLGQLGLSHTFPRPETLADADLFGLGLTRSKAAAIHALAGAVADHTIHLDRGDSLEQLVASISSVDGLGPWTAHYLALRLGEPDACPLSELDRHRLLAPQHRAASPTVVDRWRPWRALSVMHLWTAASSPEPDIEQEGAA